MASGLPAGPATHFKGFESLRDLLCFASAQRGHAMSRHLGVDASSIVDCSVYAARAWSENGVSKTRTHDVALIDSGTAP